MPLLKITDSHLYKSLATPFAGARILPVIGDGNCVFRAMIQDAVVEAMFSTKRAEKAIFINFLKRAYEKNHQLAIALRLSKSDKYSNQEEIETDFRAFIAAVEQATFEEPFSFWQDTYKLYFSTELNADRRTYKFAPKDEIVKFLALCLRAELCTNLPNGSLGLTSNEACEEYKCVDITAAGANVANYMQDEYKIFPAVFFEGQDLYDNTARRPDSVVLNLRHRMDHCDVVFTPKTIASANELHQQLELREQDLQRQQQLEQQNLLEQETKRQLELQRQEYEKLHQAHLRKKALLETTDLTPHRPKAEMTYQFNRAMSQAVLLTTIVGCVGIVAYGLSKLYSRP